MFKGKKVFWGITFIAMAALVIIDSLNIVEGIGFWSTLFTIFFGALLVKGVVTLGFGKIFFSGAILTYIWREELGVYELSLFSALLAALLVTIGFNFMFSGVKKKLRKNSYEGIHISINNGKSENIEEDFGEEVVCSTSFSSITKYVNSQNLRKVRVENKFGGACVYLDKAKAAGNDVYLELDQEFGGTEIYIPRDWVVDNRAECQFGRIDIDGDKDSRVIGTRLIVVGQVSFGVTKIKYI